MLKKTIIYLLTVVLILPVNIVHAESDLAPNAAAAVLIEASHQEMLYGKNEKEKMYPASTTKIMTLILIFEALNEGRLSMDDMVRTSGYAASMGGSQVFLEEGETLSASDMIKSIVIASANDCCVAMAEHLEGSVDAFVEKMNQKAETLKLVNTHFVNCTGLHDDNHYTCALDLGLMGAYLLDIGGEQLTNFTTMYDGYIRENEKKFWLVNTNKLLNQYEGADGLKTGFTKEAGYCLVATAKRNGVRMISVVLGEKEAKVRNQESMSLLDYGFNQYTTEQIYKAGDIITYLEVPNSKEKEIPVTTANDIVIAVKKGSQAEPDYSIEMDKHEAPIAAGEQVGRLVIMHEEKKIEEFPLIAVSEAIPLTFSQWVHDIYCDLLRA